MLGLLQRRREVPPVGATSADISGSVSDSQLAIGEHIVQNNIAAGAIVNQIAGANAPRPPRPRDKPVSVKPREAPRLLGRDQELAAAGAALASLQPVQFSGRPGAGKTAMLRHFAHRPGAVFPDGVIYYRSRRESLDDLLMRVFEFLYVSEGVKPTSAELSLYLEDTAALLLLDDVDIAREDLETLLSTLPRSVFVFGSPERSLWCDGTAIGLRGLGDDAALMLVEQYLGRPLASDEHDDFATLCRALDGQPLQIIKAVTQVREEGVPVCELVPATGAPFPSAPEQLSAQLIQTLTPEARQALVLMAALGGAPLHVDHVAALTGARDAAAMLADLEARGLAKSHSPRYSATAPLDALRSPDSEALARTQLLSYFAGHAEAHIDRPRLLRDDIEPIIATLHAGAGAGEWQGVLRLARASDGVAAYSGLWDAWHTILDSALGAARRLGDVRQEAWALHQLGTRALCLGSADEATRRLGEALRIREHIGDRAAEITRHNIDHLPGPPPPPSQPPSGPSGPSGPGWMGLCVGLVAMVGVVGMVSPGLGEGPRADAPAPRLSKTYPPTKTVAARDRDGSDPGSTEPRPRTGERGPSDRSNPDPSSPPDVPDQSTEPPSKPSPNEGSGPDLPKDPLTEIEEPPSPDPVVIKKTPPVVTSQPPPPSVVTPVSCTPQALDLLNSLVEDEIAVLQSLLETDAAAAIEKQVAVVQGLLDRLGHHCAPLELKTLVHGLTGL
jgi:hypothetical protein